METINIENLTKCDYRSGNTIDETILVYDKKNNFTFFVRPIPLDCCGTIDWTCIVKYEVYKYNGSEHWWENEFIGNMVFMNPQSLRRLYTKTLPLVVYNNPYGGETDMLRKRVNPNGKNFSGNLNGYYTFSWSACGGATFCLRHYENGTYELNTTEHPDDCWDWSEIKDFKVE